MNLFAILPEYLEENPDVSTTPTYVHYFSDIPKRRKLILPEGYRLNNHALLLKYGRILFAKDKRLQIYEIITPNEGDSFLLLDKQFKINTDVFHLAINPSENKIIYTSTDTVYMYDMNKRLQKQIFKFKSRFAITIKCEFLNDQYCYILRSNTIYIFNSAGNVVLSIKEKTTIPEIIGNTIIVLSNNNVYLYDTLTNKTKNPENFEEFTEYWLDNKNNRIVAGSLKQRDGKIIIGEWDPETGKEIGERKEFPLSAQFDFHYYISRYYGFKVSGSESRDNVFPLSQRDKEKFIGDNLKVITDNVGSRLVLPLAKIVNKFLF